MKQATKKVRQFVTNITIDEAMSKILPVLVVYALVVVCFMITLIAMDMFSHLGRDR